MGLINFDEWDEYEYNSIYIDYFEKFFNQDMSLSPSFGFVYGNLILHIDVNICNELKNYILYKGLDYDIVNNDYYSVNFNDFYIYLRMDKYKNYSLEKHSQSYMEYTVMELL